MLRMKIRLGRLPTGLVRRPAATAFHLHTFAASGGSRRRLRHWIGLARTTAGCLANATAVSAHGGKIAGDLLRAVDHGASGRIPVIVQTEGPPRAADLRQVRHMGGRVGQVFRSLPVFTAELPVRAVRTH